MKSVRLVAWREEEGRSRQKELQDLGWPVAFEPLDPGALLNRLKREPPGAVIIDLSRSPALGRDVGVALRVHGATRKVALVFAGGLPEKVEAFRKVLPDAEFTEWPRAHQALERALSNPPVDPVVPESVLAGYSGTPLPKKLGIKEGTRVLLAGAPKDFSETLGALPDEVTLVTRFNSRVDLILWFVRTASDLKRGIATWVPRVGKGGMWIIWPKKSSGIPSDLGQNLVRQTGLNAGLVDYKVAAVDPTWSGLKFAVRKQPPKR